MICITAQAVGLAVLWYWLVGVVVAAAKCIHTEPAEHAANEVKK